MKPPAGQYEITGWMGGAGETTRQQVVSKPLVNQCLLQQPPVDKWFPENHLLTSGFQGNHLDTSASTLDSSGSILDSFWREIEERCVSLKRETFPLSLPK